MIRCELDKAPKDRLSARFPDLRGAMVCCPVSTCQPKAWPVDTEVSHLRVFHGWSDDAITGWLRAEAAHRLWDKRRTA